LITAHLISRIGRKEENVEGTAGAIVGEIVEIVRLVLEAGVEIQMPKPYLPLRPSP